MELPRLDFKSLVWHNFLAKISFVDRASDRQFLRSIMRDSEGGVLVSSTSSSMAEKYPCHCFARHSNEMRRDPKFEKADEIDLLRPVIARIIERFLNNRTRFVVLAAYGESSMPLARGLKECAIHKDSVEFRGETLHYTVFEKENNAYFHFASHVEANARKTWLFGYNP